jgi:hypothetical protein
MNQPANSITSVTVVSDRHYYPLPENKEANMAHDITAELAAKAEGILELAIQNRDAFKQRCKERGNIRLDPKGPGTRLRDFIPNDPMGEWLDVSYEPGLAVFMLHNQGSVDLIELNGKFYVRPAQ